MTQSEAGPRIYLNNGVGMLRAVLINLVIGCTGASLGAQSAIPAVAQSTTTGAVTGQVLQRTISINIKNVSIESALKQIGKAANTSIVYASEVVQSGRKVTVKADNEALSSVLTRVLGDKSLRLDVSPTGDVVITRVQPTSSRTAQGVITGKVTDSKSGKGISGASVYIGSDNRKALTDEEGSYRLTGVTSGSQVVTVRLVGYVKQAKSLLLGENATITIDFKMESSTNVLDQVVVTGVVVATELKAVPNAITVITAKQIEERGITKIDQLFRGEIPGLFSQNRGSDAPLDEVIMFSRGVTALSSTTVNRGTNPIKTYVDGVELVDSKYLSQIDPSSIERIEIITGPQASTIYGSNAINGVMQVFTKRGLTSRPRVMINLTSGIIQNNFTNHLTPGHLANAAVSGVEGRASYNVASLWDYIGAWTPSKQTQRLGVSGGGRVDMSKVTVDLSTRRVLTKNKQKGDQQQVITSLRTTGIWDVNGTAGLSQPVISSVAGRTFGLSLSYRPLHWWSHDLGFGIDASALESLNNSAGFVSRTDTLLNISNADTYRRSERYTTTIQVPVTDVANMNLTVGADHWRTAGSSWSGGVTSFTGTLTPSPSVTRNRPGKNRGGFVQGQVSLKDALFFTYGLRAEWNPNYGDDAQPNLAPRYGLAYTRNIGLLSAKVRASYGRSTKPPAESQKLAIPVTGGLAFANFGGYDSRLANANLLPEHQQGGEGGIELYLANYGSLIITRYNQTVDNLISGIGGVDSVRSLDIAPTSPGLCGSSFRDSDGHCFAYQSQNLNVGSIRNQGWELQGSTNIGALTVRGTYSWTKSRVLGITPMYKPLLSGSQVTTFQPGRSFDFVPEHTWSFGITHAQIANTVSLVINGAGLLYKSGDELGLYVDPLNRSMVSRPRMELAGYRPQGSGYAIADVNAAHRFTPEMEAVIQIQNLGNYYRNDFNSRYATIGRQSKLGLRLKF